jgi:hypothetical protein
MVRSRSLVALLSFLVLGGATGPSESPDFPPAAGEPSPELLWAWHAFAKAVQANDRPALRRLSAACIHCTDCATNTAVEQAAFESYQKQHPSTWYDTYYGPRSLIPAATFWREDARLIFTDHTKARLLIPSKLAFGNNDHNKGMFVDPCIIPPAQVDTAHVEEVLVLDIDPSTKSQGMQKCFNFVKTAQGYKFCGYYTIP